MIFFSSDLHLGHQNIIQYANRPFRSVDHMNESLIDNWNNVISDGDEVYVLGDVCMGKITETLPLCKFLNGRKFLVPGNHDRCWQGSQKSTEEWQEKYSEIGFTILGSNNRMELDGSIPYLDLCHFPYVGDRESDVRFAEWHPARSKTFNVHGHTHLKHQLHDGNQIHIGTDAWDYAPVSLEEVLSLALKE